MFPFESSYNVKWKTNAFIIVHIAASLYEYGYVEDTLILCSKLTENPTRYHLLDFYTAL